MTESQTPQTTDALSAVPGLQLLGADAQAGMCVGGFCVMPGQSSTGSAPEKDASED